METQIFDDGSDEILKNAYHNKLVIDKIKNSLEGLVLDSTEKLNLSYLEKEKILKEIKILKNNT